MDNSFRFLPLDENKLIGHADYTNFLKQPSTKQNSEKQILRIKNSQYGRYRLKIKITVNLNGRIS